MKFSRLILAASLALSNFACARKDTPPPGGGGQQKATNEAVIKHVSKNVILRTYLDLAVTSKQLETKIAALAANPTQENLKAAQDAWRTTRVFWESSEAFIFGPVKDLGIDPTIDTWPLNILDLDGVLNSGNALTVEFVRGLGTNLQGFHTIEYLLFGDGKVSPDKDIKKMSSRQLEYLSACASLLSEYTQKVADAWTTNANPDDPASPGYVNIIAEPSPNNPNYPSAQSVFTELTLHMIAILDEVANGKMSDPLGGDIGSADASLVESPFSWNSLTDFTNNIRSVLNVYTGEYMANSGPGLYEIVAAKDPKLAALVGARIREAMHKIQDVAGPQGLDFRQAITDPAGRVRIQAAIDDLNQLRLLFEEKVLPLVQE